jgi:hypothetical protein
VWRKILIKSSSDGDQNSNFSYRKATNSGSKDIASEILVLSRDKTPRNQDRISRLQELEVMGQKFVAVIGFNINK